MIIFSLEIPFLRMKIQVVICEHVCYLISPLGIDIDGQFTLSLEVVHAWRWGLGWDWRQHWKNQLDKKYK